MGLGKIAHAVLTSRRRIALDNLRRAFKDEKSEDEIAIITKNVFINIARSTVEITRFPLLGKEGVLKIVPEHSGSEYFEQVKKEGRGCVMVTGHMGNWELVGSWVCALGYPISFLVGRQHNPYVHDAIVRMRKSTGVGVITAGAQTRQAIKLLKKNEFVAMVSDQHSTSGATIVDFFGRRTATHTGAAAFAVKLNIPIISGYIIREKYNRHRAVIEAFLEMRAAARQQGSAWALVRTPLRCLPLSLPLSLRATVSGGRSNPANSPTSAVRRELRVRA